MKRPELFDESNAATYCPEDDKLRLYVGRVPRDQYEALRAEGWTSTPKQDCDFVAVWTPEREDTALSYAGEIDDEDQSPADRAADRAERFAGYRDKRTADALRHADHYDAGPSAHGYQSKARAVKAADRHDRIADRALTQWDKAEYWTRRTAGVIAHALHTAAPGVRMGRIKTLEAELRKAEKAGEEHAARHRWISSIAKDPAAAVERIAAKHYAGNTVEATRSLCENIAGHGMHRNPANPESPAGYYYQHAKSEHPPTVSDYAARWLALHPAPESPEFEETGSARNLRHLQHRLAYERQMLDAQGGRAASLDMEKGGTWLGGVIAKVNKSTASGRVVSVAVIVPTVSRWTYKTTNVPGTPYALATFETERGKPGSYAAPTPESLAKLAEFEAARKAANAKAPKAPPLVNPTDAEAERLQAVWNEQDPPHYGDAPAAVVRMSQADYSARSGGSYASAETVEIIGGGRRRGNGGFMRRPLFPAVAKVRRYGRSVVVLEDKPQKPLPPSAWVDPRPAVVEEVRQNIATLKAAACRAWNDRMTEEETRIFNLARMVGLAYADSATQFGLTEEGKALAATITAAPAPAPADA